MVCHKKRSHELNYFIDPTKCETIVQMEGLETTILTGLGGEKMMMVLNATMLGHSVPLHSHPHEQVGMAYSGKAILKSGARSDWLRRETSFVSQAIYPTATPMWVKNPS